MLCKAWLEFTRSYKHAPKVNYAFPTKGGTVNLTTTDEATEDL